MPFIAATTARLRHRAEQWRLTVDGPVDSREVTYDRLMSGFHPHSVVATLVCAGNRRAELLNLRPIPGKVPWAHGASRPPNGAEPGCRRPRRGWSPPRRGLDVAFAAPDVAPEAVPVQSSGSSIPLTKAMSDGVLLAWQMNCRTASTNPRRPVRVVGPGLSGPQRQVGHRDHRVTPFRRKITFRPSTIRPSPRHQPGHRGAGEAFRCRRSAQLRHPGPRRRRGFPAGPLTIRGGRRPATAARRPRRRFPRRAPHLATSQPGTCAQPMGMATVVSHRRGRTGPLS